MTAVQKRRTSSAVQEVGGALLAANTLPSLHTPLCSSQSTSCTSVWKEKTCAEITISYDK